MMVDVDYARSVFNLGIHVLKQHNDVAASVNNLYTGSMKRGYLTTEWALQNLNLFHETIVGHVTPQDKQLLIDNHKSWLATREIIHNIQEDPKFNFHRSEMAVFKFKAIQVIREYPWVET